MGTVRGGLRAARVLPVLLLALITLVASPLRAAADTSQSWATAVDLTLAGGSLLGSGQAAATNDGLSPTVDTVQNPALSLLGSQSLLNLGVLSQRAIAYADGSSVACAGLTGSGGSVAVSPDGTCTSAGGDPDGVVIDLLGLAKIKADAIVASCRAASDGTVTATAKLAHAAVYLSVLGADVPLLTLAANPAPNSGLNVLSLAALQTNVQTSSGAGNLRATALHVGLVGSLVSADVGIVDCGANVRTAPTPAIPLPVLPIGIAVAVAAALSPPGRALLGGVRDLARS